MTNARYNDYRVLEQWFTKPAAQAGQELRQVTDLEFSTLLTLPSGHY